MDVCGKLRGIFRERRIGHAGTLDPMATGVLPVFVGRATRAVEFAAEGGKEYVAGLQLGLVTDTQDTSGRVLNRTEARVSRDELEGVLSAFRGEIAQIPPMYSAIKKNGKKLYELARKGQEVERQPRPVVIYALEVLEQSGPDAFLLRVECSKGTYVRTLCHDIGQALGCGGAMCSLRRIRAAGFDLSRAVTLEQVIRAGEAGAAEELLMPVDAYFAQEPALTISGAAERKCRNGNAFPWPGEDGTYRVYGEDGTFLMLGWLDHGTMVTVKSFFDVN